MNDVESLTQCLNTIEQKVKDKVVIVPGGGLFANQVRLAQKQWQFNDEIAHEMAILSMQQMALLFKSIKPNFLVSNIVSTKFDNKVVIWSPDIKQLNQDGIEASWDITSDSLAAWLAKKIQADELILVKSADVPEKMTINQMQKQGLVDKAFEQFTHKSSYNIALLNKYSFNEYTFI